MRVLLFAVLAVGAAACTADRKLPEPAAPPPPAAVAKLDDKVTGRIEAPDASGASHALVALNGGREKRLAVTRADEQGRFDLPRPGEPFAITVTSPQGTAVFVPPIDPGKAPATPLLLRLGEPSSGTVVAGTVKVVGGALPNGALVSASRLSKDEGDTFFGDVSSDGAFALRLPPGSYMVRVDSDEVITRAIKVSGDAGAREEAVLNVSTRAPAPAEVVAWLKGEAIPISTAEVGTPDQDLAPLVAALGDARVIGVGETTHGTLEFTRIKHRLLERLVATHGVTDFAMEANFGAAERVDEYLQTGRGTPEEAVRNLFLVWQTEEVRDLVAWMRRYNADPKHRKKIRFRGYDVQGAERSIAAVRAYLRRVDPPAESLLQPLAPLDVHTNNHGMVELTEAEKSETGAAAARLVEHFGAQENAYVKRSSAAAYALAAQHARVVQQAQTLFAAKDFREEFIARDRAMGDNVVWLAEHADPDARVMVWAHNGHVQLDSADLPGPNMGQRIRQRLGAGYVSVGFLVNQGAYRACPDPKEPRTTVEVPLGSVEPGFAAEAFARVDIPIFAVDLRKAPTGIVADWLTAPHLLQSFGWIVQKDSPKGYPGFLAHAFDVAVHVDHTTASRPLPPRS